MNEGALINDRLKDYDIAAHNEEVKEVWDSFNRREPKRVPCILGTNTRYFMLLPEANPEKVDFREYSDDPDLMYETLLRFARFSAFGLSITIAESTFGRG